MANVTIEDPDFHKTGMVIDGGGRVFVSKKHIGRKVNIVVEMEDEDESR